MLYSDKRLLHKAVSSSTKQVPLGAAGSETHDPNLHHLPSPHDVPFTAYPVLHAV